MISFPSATRSNRTRVIWDRSSRLMLAVLSLAVLVCIDLSASAQEKEGSLFENVVRALEQGYFDKDFRRDRLPDIVERYRKMAYDAETLREQREVVQAMLSNIPASHMGLLSKSGHERLLGELQNVVAPTFGFELIEYDGKHYAHGVLEGGPAERAGLKRGDRIVMIDETPMEDHPRLDWRTDDAYLPDPPVRSLLVEEDDVIQVVIERGWGELMELEIEADDYSAFEAAKASARVIEHDGKRIGYIHYWLIHMTGVTPLLKEKLNGEFADCDALVLDLRGRGGNGMAIRGLLKALQGDGSNWSNPVVALINRNSRSAKEVIAYELREQNIALLVGETTAGAVIPASFEDVGHDSILMFPTFKLGRHTERLEGVGVPPDVAVEDARPYSGGADPVLEVGVREAARLASEYAKAGPAEKVASEVATATRPALELEKLDASEVLVRLVDALGGEDAIRRHSSQTIVGTVDISGMLEGSLRIQMTAPNLMVQQLSFEGLGNFRSGHDGTVAWRDDPQRGKAIMEGEEREDQLEQADLFAVLNYERHYDSIEMVGPAEFAGQPCYELEMTRSSGSARTVYINAETFLEAGSRTMQPSPMGGEVELVVTNQEYRAFDGVLILTSFKQNMGEMQELNITIDEVSFDPIDESVFALPESIRPLLEDD